MKGLLNAVQGLSRVMNAIAGSALVFLMFLTISDVILRFFKRPIVGTYELVAFSGAVVIGFSLPLTSWLRAHIFVDFLVLKFSKKVQNIFHVATRCVAMLLFMVAGWNLVIYGLDLKKSGEVSSTLQMPFYPIAFGVALSCFILCLVLLCDIVKISGGQYE
jgi:TRAP-type C4-dicarboxylate transport system permease small subunit